MDIGGGFGVDGVAGAVAAAAHVRLRFELHVQLLLLLVLQGARLGRLRQDVGLKDKDRDGVRLGLFSRFSWASGAEDIYMMADGKFCDKFEKRNFVT